MADQELPFKISSGLKNIIGKDLITDDYIAVFELVKNSFDAYANKVDIIFEEDKIIIRDDGKGMDYDDIINKWLFVAYSAKKEGEEDIDLEEEKYKSYRDKIQSKRFFAGAKGIGRFSCDRLGRKLVLTTKKAYEDSNIEQIVVNWKDFEQDAKKEFVNIKVKYRKLEQNTKKLKSFKNGTILEITELNSFWDRNKKIELKHSLEKLITPFEESEKNPFKIFIEDNKEKEKDKIINNSRDSVNGEVKNFVFETLKLSTTQILTEIDEIGDFITISIKDRGTNIYKIRKQNNTNPQLKNIKFNLFFLNRSAKSNFTRLMGIEPVNFGSIYLYKNGVRISPYGNPGDDSFGIDRRHGQKYKGTLASRDLIGRIEILGENPNFIETSSRDVGFVKNDDYKSLINCFDKLCLTKLENYVTKIQWPISKITEDKDSRDTSIIEHNYKAKSILLNLLANEISDENTELEDIDTKFLNLRTQELLKSANEEEIENLKFIANKFEDKVFKKEIKNTEEEFRKIKELEKKLFEEEEKKKRIEEEKKRIEEELELEKEKNTYLRTSSRSLSEDAKGLVHNIKFTAKAINSNVDTLYEKIILGKAKNEEILRRLSVIKFNSEKALKISKLITRSNFKTQQNEQIIDVVSYIDQYISIYSDIYDKSQLNFSIEKNGVKYEKKVSILDISVILDDLISNSEKAGAKKIKLVISLKNEKQLIILFSDDGRGLNKKFLNNPDEIFELGVTTTDGSGIGLHLVRTALKQINGTVVFKGNNVLLKGATFELIIN
jgi:signal transduction histidine kinase